MDATREDGRLDRRPIVPRPDNERAIDAAWETGQKPPSLRVRADDPGQTRASTKRHDEAGDTAGHDIAGDEDAAVGEAVYECQEPILALGFAGEWMKGTDNQHDEFAAVTGPCYSCLRIQLTAAIRLSTIASAVRSGRGRASSVRP